LIVRAALLLAGVSTYLISRDDVVWHFIRTAPRARALEHTFFGIAAALLGIALLLRVKADARPVTAGILQAMGIGSLLPLPGFLLLVLGEAITGLILRDRHATADDPGGEGEDPRGARELHAFRWRDALTTYPGLCCAFLSMVIFSAVLIDRVADVLFAMTALVSVAANLQSFLRSRS
jgi:hypothetical protein